MEIEGKEFEVGVIQAHPLVAIWKQAKTIWSTWRHARKLGLPCNRWFGVYGKGNELKYAEMGSLPGAEERARLFAAQLNAISKASQP